jgi:hypothetical protein
MPEHPRLPSVSRAGPVNPEGELRRFKPVPDAVVLAAVARAERHRQREHEGVMMSDVAAHLGFLHRPWTTRSLRPQLDALASAGLLVRSRRNGIPVLVLTSNGRRRLARARQGGETVDLGEAPQHRDWRHARVAASERIDRFREEVRQTLDEARWVLDAERADSDAWFDLGERLQHQCRQVGSATYCLREWVEPDDASADVDDYHAPGDHKLDAEERKRWRSLRRGRRNTRGWKSPRAGDA